MSSSGSTRNKRSAVGLLVVALAGGCLSACARAPQERKVYVNWQALQVYHPLWDARALQSSTEPAQFPPPASIPASFSLPSLSLQPLLTPESERRRQRALSRAVQQQQALNVRLQAMEARLLQSELALLEAEQQAEIEALQQEARREREYAIEQALREYRQQQAPTEIRRRLLQSLLRSHPAPRTPLAGVGDRLASNLAQVEAEQQSLSSNLQKRLAQIQEAIDHRMRERVETIQRNYEQRRNGLLERSAERLQAEQQRASAQLRPFTDSTEPHLFAREVMVLPSYATGATVAPPPALPRADLRPILAQDTKKWIEAICRRHRWKPTWQPQAGVPDVTSQIADEMRGLAE